MPELRKDPIVGRWVIISTDRAKRPPTLCASRLQKKGGFCPFCAGNENKTPSEVLAYRPNGAGRDGSGWTVRVVPNKFPALGIEGSLSRQAEGMFDKMNGIGAHEVIIETPEHDVSLADLREKRIEDVLWAFRDRILDLKKDKRFKYILIFKNHGTAAGATLEHSHGQLIALPIVPKHVWRRWKAPSSITSTRSAACFATSFARRPKLVFVSSARTKTSSPSLPMRRGFRLRPGSCPSGMSRRSRTLPRRSTRHWPNR